MKKPSYRENRYWENYQPFFPERMRVGSGSEAQEEWWNWNGIDIHIDRQTADNPKPVKLVLLHGGGGHGRLLAPIGKLLKERGVSSIAPDLPGYGLSSSPAEFIRYDQWINLCVDLVAREVARDSVPVVLLGVSLGGMLSYYVACKSKQVKGVIATTLCDPRYEEVQDAFMKYQALNRLLLPLVRWIPESAKAIRLPIKWFSKMDKISNSLKLTSIVVNDPLGGGNKTPLSFMLSILETVPDIEPEQFERCPVLLAHPQDDRWTPFEMSKMFFDRIKGPKQCLLLENAGHIPIEQPGLAQLEESVETFILGL